MRNFNSTFETDIIYMGLVFLISNFCINKVSHANKWMRLYTANDYRQTTDELMFKGVISTQRCIKKLNIVECAINK